MGLTSTDKNSSFYKKVHSRKFLNRAWQKVYENGISSKSLETRKDIISFSENADSKIEQIYRQLLKKQYKFKASKGIPKSRKNKKDRPIVISQIPDRIVQRRILDVLQQEPQIKEYISVKTSFGGIEKRGVKDAIEMAYKAMQSGAKWYISSDIQDFFTNIPRETVLKKISQFIHDEDFNALLKAAINVELENLAQLGEKKELFPIYEIGVAQGCSLSPLMGNILLYDFDIDLNGRGIICLRYIDDFIVLGPTQEKVKAAFKSVKRKLKDLGFYVYDPFEEKQKAHFGQTEKGFTFLGCEIFPGLIRPTNKTRANIIEKVKKMLAESSRLMSDPTKMCSKRKSVVDTLMDVSNVIMGWGNQYSFCNDFAIMEELDRKINELLAKYLQQYKRARDICKEDLLRVRRLLGVRLLVDCKSDPII